MLPHVPAAAARRYEGRRECMARNLKQVEFGVASLLYLRCRRHHHHRRRRRRR